eukprot:181893-Chlamydomonas_euryale.AAC.2
MLRHAVLFQAARSSERCVRYAVLHCRRCRGNGSSTVVAVAAVRAKMCKYNAVGGVLNERCLHYWHGALGWEDVGLGRSGRGRHAARPC